MTQTSSSQFRKQFQKTLQTSKTKEVDYGVVEMPPVKGAIAKLDTVKIGKYKSGANEGQMYLYLGATAVEPSVNDAGHKVAGLLTNKMCELCATEYNGTVRSLAENIDRTLNEVKKLGVDLKQLPKGSGEEELVDLINTYIEAGTYFVFDVIERSYDRRDPRTKKSERVTRTYHNWNGIINLPEDYSPPEDDEDIEDESAEIEDEELDDEEGEEGDEIEDEVDSDESDEGEDEDDEEDEIVPEKEEVYLYKPPRSRKSIECEVTAVFKSKRTVNLKGDNGKVYKSVSWSDLSLD